MADSEFLALERRLWLEGIDTYQQLLSPGCIMAFPAPVGLLRGAAIRKSLEGVPRWSEVTMSETLIAYPDSNTAVQAYHAIAKRPGSKRYSAYCTSTYHNDGSGWRLVQHQQTPD